MGFTRRDKKPRAGSHAAGSDVTAGQIGSQQAPVVTDSEAVVAASAPVTKRRHRDELLASVIPETAVPAAMDLLKNNGPFVLPGGNAYVILILDTDKDRNPDFGGLSKRQNKDPDKGSAVQQMTADHIKTIATPGMLADQVLGIIPEAGTLDCMAEYSFLVKAAYSWAACWLEDDGSFHIKPLSPASFGTAKDVCSGVIPLSEAIGPKAWAEYSTAARETEAVPAAALASGDSISDTPVAVSSEPVPAEVAVAAVGVSGGGVDGEDGDELFAPVSEGGVTGPGDFGGIEFADDAPGAGGLDDTWDDGLDSAPAEPVVPVPVVAVLADPAPVIVEPAEAVVREEAVAEPVAVSAVAEQVTVQVVQPVSQTASALVSALAPAQAEFVPAQDQGEIRSLLARRFGDGGVELTVDLADFYAVFPPRRENIALSVPSGLHDWLGAHAAQIAAQAGADLAQMRERHDAELQVLYVNLMSAHNAQVLREVSEHSAGSRYADLRKAADAAHAQRSEHLSEVADARREEMAARFEARVTEAGEAAKLTAQVRYRDQNRRRAEQEAHDALAAVRADVDIQRDADEREIARVRQADADAKSETGKNAVLEALAGKQREFMADEQAALSAWDAKLQALVEDNRRHDIAQYEGMAEQQRRNDTVAVLKADQEAALAAVISRHQERVAELEAEAVRVRESASAQIREREAEWQKTFDEQQSRSETQSAQITDLMSQVRGMDEIVTQRFQSRIALLEAGQQAHAGELSRQAQTHSRTVKTLILLMIVLAVVMAGAGFIGGSLLG